MSPLAATLSALVWTPCPDLGPNAECSTVQVPDNHDDVEAGLLTLAVRRIRAPSGTTRGHLWYVPDGPGVSGITAAQALDAVHQAIAPDFDLLTLDVRGVGFSARLDCPDEGATPLSDAQWTACAERWEPDRVELRRYTTTQTALDLVFAIERAREDLPVFVWTSGYGSLLVDRMLSIVDDGIDGVLVDGAMPVDWSAYEADAQIDGVARGLATACDADPACGLAVGGDATQLASDLLARLDDGHCASAGLGRSDLRQLGARLLHAGPDWASQLPAVWTRLDRCERRDQSALDWFMGQLPARPVESQALARQVTLTDLWDDPPGVTTAEVQTQGSLVSDGRTVSRVSTPWPFTDPGEFHRFVPPTDVPMLLLHGTQDPEVSVARAQDRAADFRLAVQRLVTVPHAMGRPLLEAGCAQALARGFLTDPTAAPAEGCEATPWSFAPDPVVDDALWAEPDRYGTTGCATPVGGAGWSALLLVGLLLPGRRKHRSEQETPHPFPPGPP